MSNEKLGVAVVGLGFVGGRAHVPAIAKLPHARLAAVIDVNESTARSMALNYHTQYYTDFQQALQDSRIDAVIISVPTPFHYQLTAQALAQGKHVLCEMPLTPTIELSLRLRELARQQDVILMPDLNLRFTPNYRKVKQLVDQGVIGHPLAVTFQEYIAAHHLQRQWPLGSWAWDVQTSGGNPDFTLSVYAIDAIRWLLHAEITEAHWMSRYTPLDGFDGWTGYNTVGTLRFSNGLIGTLHFSATVQPQDETTHLRLFGSNTRTIQAINNSQVLLSNQYTYERWRFPKKGTKAWGHRQIDEHFVQCVLGETTPLVTPDDAIASQQVAAQMVETPLKTPHQIKDTPEIIAIST
jgi:predicted dehydrogenase